MRSKLVCSSPQIWVLVFDKGDEVIGQMEDFARTHDIRGAGISGIGGFSSAVLAYFERATLQYEKHPIDEQVEVLSMLGNISRLQDGSVKVHIHVTIGHQNLSATGGHLISGTVWPTLELFVTGTAPLQRGLDADTKLPLLQP